MRTRQINHHLRRSHQWQRRPRNPFMPNNTEDVVAGHCVQPAGRIRRHPNERPPLQGANKRLLHGLLGNVKLSGPNHPNEGGSNPPSTTPKKLLNNSPGLTRPGPITSAGRTNSPGPTTSAGLPNNTGLTNNAGVIHSAPGYPQPHLSTHKTVTLMP